MTVEQLIAALKLYPMDTKLTIDEPRGLKGEHREEVDLRLYHVQYDKSKKQIKFGLQ